MKWIRIGLVAALVAACGGSGAKTIDAAPTPDSAVHPDGGGADGGMADAGQPPTKGRSAGGIVAGGVTASSPNFRLVGTLNSGNGTASSPSFKVHSGVIGATQ